MTASRRNEVSSQRVFLGPFEVSSSEQHFIGEFMDHGHDLLMGFNKLFQYIIQIPIMVLLINLLISFSYLQLIS